MSSDRGPAGGRQEHHLPVRTVRIPLSSSMDLGDKHKQDPSYSNRNGYGEHHGPPASFTRPGSHQPYPSYATPMYPPQRLNTVVTGSFSSFEEERDDFSGRARGLRYETNTSSNQDMYHQDYAPGESRYPDEGNVREGTERREGDHTFLRPQTPAKAVHAMPNHATMIPPSPSSKRSIEEMRQGFFEAPGPTSRPPPDLLKRNFFHHSRPEDQRFDSLPPAFAPPKKPKIDKAPRSDKVIYSRTSPHYFHRAHSWQGQDGRALCPPHQHVHKANSFPSQASWNGNTPEHYRGGLPEEPMEGEYPSQWSSHDRRSAPSAFRGAPSSRSPQGPQPYYPVNRSNSFNTGEQWHGSHGGEWGPPPMSPPGISPSWSGPMAAPPQHHREDIPSRPAFREISASGGERDNQRHRGYSYDRPAMQGIGHSQYTMPTSEGPPYRSSYAMETPQRRYHNPLPSVMESDQDFQEGPRADRSLRLLAQPEDRISLSETLCTIRENIEVFTATVSDVQAPAPGRKHPVVVGQVGLRCIHCTHAVKSSDKVKRAVCYPSSIKRIYRTVIDMKLDHFQHCPFVPLALKERLEALKVTNTRSTGTTMQYFVRSAKKMGMVDGSSGVRLFAVEEEKKTENVASPELKDSSPKTSPISSPEAPAAAEEREPAATPGSEVDSRGSQDSREHSFSDESMGNIQMHIAEADDIPTFNGIVSLSIPEDKTALSPLRCFLRENTCAFSATEEDIAVRTPTTFSVVLGQVGIGCIHCHKLPAKERSNRAVCFPFSIGRIYQSVADIQRFHMAECKMVPPELREKFIELQSGSSKGSKGLATRQYWISSAKKIGLVDTSRGIRFGRDPSVPCTPAVSLDILAQVASNVTTVNRPLVLPEDKNCIAEFLYVVMEQLQPCRFTEADRNKRRLKDVGCIGVECKHCAGQVESRKFFWSSVNAVESNFVSVHTHMMECRMVPEPLKQRLVELKALRKEQTANLKIGSQKTFFARVWDRLHRDVDMNPTEAKSEGNDEAKSPHAEIVESVRDKMAVVSV